MRFVVNSTLTLFIALTGVAYADNAVELKDYSSKLNYSVGYQIGSDFKVQRTEVRPDAIIKGIEDALSGNEALMSKEEMQQAMAELGKKVTAIKQEYRKKVEEYAEENRQFLVENAKRPDVVTTESGLQYRIIDKRPRNERRKPGPESEVLVKYTGTLIDGTVFDSSAQRGKPTSFKVNQVIMGWQEALQLMGQGDHWQLFIPAELAYGDRLVSTIPRNSTLIFDVELIAVK